VTSAEKYVTAAYLVVLGVVLLWVVIYAFRLSRLEREVADLAELARANVSPPPAPKRGHHRAA
jgi:hypothetical protein